jgi:hypothetical protein
MPRHRDPRDAAVRPAAGPVWPALLDVAAFGCELAMLAVLGIGGWGLGSGGLLSVAFATFYPALAVLVWALWMAPTAAHRLADPWRLVAQLALFAGTAVVAGLGGHPVLGVVFAVVAGLVFAGTRLGHADEEDTAQAGSSPSSSS